MQGFTSISVWSKEKIWVLAQQRHPVIKYIAPPLEISAVPLEGSNRAVTNLPQAHWPLLLQLLYNSRGRGRGGGGVTRGWTRVLGFKLMYNMSSSDKGGVSSLSRMAFQRRSIKALGVDFKRLLSRYSNKCV